MLSEAQIKNIIKEEINEARGVIKDAEQEIEVLYHVIQDKARRRNDDFRTEQDAIAECEMTIACCEAQLGTLVHLLHVFFEHDKEQEHGIC